MHLGWEYLQVLWQNLSCLGFFLLCFNFLFHLIHWLYIIKSHGFDPFEVVFTSPRESLTSVGVLCASVAHLWVGVGEGGMVTK